MTWGNTYNRHKATGMDPNDAAFRADQSDVGRRRKAERDETIQRLRDALIQADLTIRAFPGTDQSDVEFIRVALMAISEATPIPHPPAE